MDESDPKSIAARISDRSARRSGLVISTPDHPSVRAALTDAQRDGLPIVQVVTQSLPETQFVGIDNYAAGRMAGLMMARLGAVRGTVIALCHSQVYRVHRDRVRGFSDYLEDHGGERLSFRFIGFNLDDRQRGAARISEALSLWPDLAGIYNAGGGNTGVLDFLRHSGRDVFFVGHELNELTRRALNDGVADIIFDQHPEAQARRATDLLLAKIGLLDVTVDSPPIPFTTTTAENA